MDWPKLRCWRQRFEDNEENGGEEKVLGGKSGERGDVEKEKGTREDQQARRIKSNGGKAG